MRKPVIKTCLVLGLMVAVLLLLAALVPPAPPVLPTFQFLAGQNTTLTVRDPNNPWNHGHFLEDFYSFAGDFNGLCEAAAAELSALGYTEIPPHPETFFPMREFQFLRSQFDEPITVRITGRAKLMVFSTPKNSQYSSPDRYDYRPQAGWVTVEIYQRPRPPRLWQNLAWRVDRLLRSMGLRR